MSSLPASAPPFVVLHFRGVGWRILHHGRRWGRFESKGDAVDAALRIAANAASRGLGQGEILVQSAAGELVRMH